MNYSARDRLINTGMYNVYYLLVLLLITLIGGIYVTNLLPAYEPSTLAQPHALVFVEYLTFFVGGLITFASFVFKDRILGLKIQLGGLITQTVGLVAAVATAIAFAGVGVALFLVIWGTLFSVMHISRIFLLRRDIRNAPLKREIGEKVKAPDNGRRSDRVLETLVILQSRIDELESINTLLRGRKQ